MAKIYHKLTLLLSLIAVMIITTACHLETDNVEGDLEGFWHLTSIEVTDSTGNVKTIDYSSKRIFWSFQGKILAIEDKDGENPGILYTTSKSGNTLTLSKPYINNRMEDDPEVTDLEVIAWIGFDTMTPILTFSSSNNSISITSQDKKWHFEKF